MANVQAIRQALASQLQDKLGIPAFPNVPPNITPPMICVYPGQPYLAYGQTMGEGIDAAIGGFGPVLGEPIAAMAKTTIMLTVGVFISQATGYEEFQPQLDALLEPPGNTGSIPNAIALDETLAGLVDWAIPLDVASYGLIQDIAGQSYFGARVRVQVGA